MRKPIMICLLAVCAVLWAGCKKPGSSLTDKWIGNYEALNPHDTIVSVIITASSDKFLKMQIKAQSTGYIYNYTTLQQVGAGPTQCIIHENQSITGDNGPYDIQGTVTMAGQDITMHAIATQGADVRNIDFAGRRQ